jgi:hypothetical protein
MTEDSAVTGATRRKYYCLLSSVFCPLNNTFRQKRTAANACRVAFSRIAVPSRLACNLLERPHDAAVSPACPPRRSAFAAALAVAGIPSTFEI